MGQKLVLRRHIESAISFLLILNRMYLGGGFGFSETEVNTLWMRLVVSTSIAVTHWTHQDPNCLTFDMICCAAI